MYIHVYLRASSSRGSRPPGGVAKSYYLHPMQYDNDTTNNNNNNNNSCIASKKKILGNPKPECGLKAKT